VFLVFSHVTRRVLRAAGAIGQLNSNDDDGGGNLVSTMEVWTVRWAMIVRPGHVSVSFLKRLDLLFDSAVAC